MFHFSYRVRAIRWPLPYDRLWLNETKPPDPPAGNGPLPPPIRTPEELQVQKIPREQSKKFALNWQDEPLLRVSPGESFEIETWDASTGFFQTPEDKAIPANRPGFDRVPPLANPIGGPVYLEGAQRGDTLVVTVEDILVADFSWTANGPGRGPLGDSNRWPEISTEYTTYILKHEPGPSGTTRDGTIHFNDRISWPVTPFIGTIGVAPDREVVTSGDGQGAWGGNLDIRDVAPGNRVHLPVYHDGALFYLGDVQRPDFLARDSIHRNDRRRAGQGSRHQR